MKKNLQNAMAKNFQKMVNEQPAQDTPSKKSATATVKKEEKKAVTQDPEKVETNTPVMNEPVDVTPEPVPQVPVQPTVNVQPQQAPQPMVQPVVQQIAEPVAPVQSPNIPIQQSAPVYVQSSASAVTPSYVEAPVPAQYVTPVIAEQQPVSRVSTKKSIPLMPEEKSSGVLHIRLGELRSYVDFMTQSGKISYQQYISNLIEQDYEKNKDLYLKYKSFMDQLNM